MVEPKAKHLKDDTIIFENGDGGGGASGRVVQGYRDLSGHTLAGASCGGPVSYTHLDGSYLRLKNLEIGYTFPKELLQKARISNLRVYISGNNLYTWKNNKYPMDPDAREVWGRVYPPMRVYNIGVNFQF